MFKKTTNLKQTIRQHLQGEAFFTGFSISQPHSKTLKQDTQPTPPASIQVPIHTTTDPNRQDLNTVNQAVVQCRKCRLGTSRTHAVPGEGNYHARLMFVGEAPGADEDTQGRPFVGRAGQLLDKIIVACGLHRSDVFIANTLKCRPPDNRDPNPDEITSCLPFLQQQIRLIGPEVIVALGAHAARTVLDSQEAIGRLRGRFHPCALAPDLPVKVMPTYHPAYLLRNYSEDNRRCVWEDMKKVLAELGLQAPPR